MTISNNPIIRAEIRRWRRNAKAVEGFVYNDKQDCFEDGESIVILLIKDVRESPTFFLIETEGGIYKLPKDEKE